MGLLDRLLGKGHNETRSPFGVDVARIYSMRSVDTALSNLCETALAQNKFLYHGALSDGSHMISFTCDGITYVGRIGLNTVPEFGTALIVNSVHKVGPDGTSAYLQKLRECYGVPND